MTEAGDRRFAGATAVVVGAGRGIGRACALDLAGHGAHVVAVDADADAAAQARAAVEEHGGQAAAEIADDADLGALEQIAARCADALPPVRVLVNAQMATERASIEASSMASWERVVRANLLGPVATTKAFLPLLTAAHGAAVVHVGSVDGLQGNPAVPSYSASKGGLIPLTHVMADELAPRGIRVNCVARAAVVDGSATDPPAGVLAALTAQTPLGRPADAAEVAATVRFLASEDASYVTGAVLVVDGGRTAITPGTRPPPEERSHG